MRRLAGILALCCLPWPAWAVDLWARVDLSDQEMTVIVRDGETYRWPVSTARAGKFTPTGLYSVQAMKPMHYSTLYDNAPMPWSIFFSGNFAIHGTTQTDRLGTPASAGCIRLHPDNAQRLYELVQELGRANTLIEIVD